MSLENDITMIMEADIFKPAGPDELAKRGYTGKEYDLWVGGYWDGMMRDKESAIRTAKKIEGASVYEVEAGQTGFSHKNKGVKVYPLD